MKKFAASLALFLLFASLPAQPAGPPPQPAAAPVAASDRLVSQVYEWEKLVATPNDKGVRRMVFDGTTTALDNIHCHITTLKPGEKSGEPTKHVQEEIFLVKEGTVEMNWDGQSKSCGPGSVIFMAAGATTFLRNAGTTPCTYVVIYYFTPLTPKP